MLKLGLLGMLGVAVAGMPIQLHAQNTNRTAVEKKEAKPRKPGVVPFHGKVKAVDRTAKTIMVKNLVIQITSETKIVKAGKRAVLEDAVVGEEVGGAYKKAADGTLNATTVRFGPKEAKQKSVKAELTEEE